MLKKTVNLPSIIQSHHIRKSKDILECAEPTMSDVGEDTEIRTLFSFIPAHRHTNYTKMH